MINQLISVYEIDLVKKEFIYLKSILNKIDTHELVHIVPIDCYSTFYIYPEFSSFLHCFSIRDKRFSSIDLKKSMVDKEEKKYMQIARKYNKKGKKNNLDLDDIVMITGNS